MAYNIVFALFAIHLVWILLDSDNLKKLNKWLIHLSLALFLFAISAYFIYEGKSLLIIYPSLITIILLTIWYPFSILHYKIFKRYPEFSDMAKKNSDSFFSIIIIVASLIFPLIIISYLNSLLDISI